MTTTMGESMFGFVIGQFAHHGWWGLSRGRL